MNWLATCSYKTGQCNKNKIVCYFSAVSVININNVKYHIHGKSTVQSSMHDP